MSNIERYQPAAWVSTLEPVAALAAQIASTEFVPSAMRGSVAKVTACILFGQELGLGPLQSLAKIDIIEGRPAPKAELARALVLAAGHEVVVEVGQTKCTARGRRRGSDEWTVVTWTMDDAKRAGLDGKQNWRKWPRQMLAARATAELARLAFADCLGGVSLFAEELEDDAPPSVGAQDEPGAPKRGRRLSTTTPPPERAEIATEPPTVPYEPPLPGEDDIIDAEVIEDVGPELLTDPQLKKLLATLSAIGVKEKGDRLGLVSDLIGRTLTTSKELTKAEATTVIDRLMDVEDGRGELVMTEDGLRVVPF